MLKELLAFLIAFFAICWPIYLNFVLKEPVGDASRVVIDVTNSKIEIQRDADTFITKIKAKDLSEHMKGLGYVHARDRTVQMFLVRAIVQGRLSELFSPDETGLQVDTFMRNQGFSYFPEGSLNELNTHARASLQDYADGVNRFLQEGSLPWEFSLVNFKPEIWKIEDSLSILRLMMFLGLLENQVKAEKTIINAMQTDDGYRLMKALFAPHLDDFDTKNLDIIRKLKYRTDTHPDVNWLTVVPKLEASNNWAISSKKSKSGHAIYASDPHLNVLQLPVIWYESLTSLDDGNYLYGISTPGMPAIAMGRTQSIAWGFTYGFMDLVDFFIEDCEGNTCRKGNESVPISRRTEIIKKKDGSEPSEIVILTTTHGVLEVPDVNSDIPLEKGYYLARAAAHDLTKGIPSVECLNNILTVKNVKDAQAIFSKVDISSNLIFIDSENNIGYQQTGALPLRVHSGIYPLLGWDVSNDWKGLAPKDNLVSIYNPPSGILASANNNWNDPNKPVAVNLHMGEYRASRIQDLLKEKEKLDLEDMKRIQGDLISSQAERYMEILRPLIPTSPVGNILLQWNCSYDKNAKGAVLFEEFYSALYDDVFGKVAGKAWLVAKEETSAFFSYYDKLIFEYNNQHDALLWRGESRDQIFSRVLQSVLRDKTPESVPTYGDTRQLYMENIFFAGKMNALTRFFKLDFGPFALEGNRATIRQGQYFQTKGRQDSFAPSWRFVSDIHNKYVETSLPGGPSGYRFSGLYTSDTLNWINMRYKNLSLY